MFHGKFPLLKNSRNRLSNIKIQWETNRSPIIDKSTAKIIAMARQRNDFTLTCGGEELRAEWIPDNAITLGIKNLKLTAMKLEICYYF